MGIEVFIPVERGRAIVREQFTRIDSVNAFSEPSSLVKVWRGSLTPYEVGVRRVAYSACNSRLQSRFEPVVTLAGSLPRRVGKISWISIAGEKLRSDRICSRYEIGRDAHN